MYISAITHSHKSYDSYFGIFDSDGILKKEANKIVRESGKIFLPTEKLKLHYGLEYSIGRELIIPLKYKKGLDITEVFRTEEESDGLEIVQCSYLLLLLSEKEEGMFACLMLEKNKFRHIKYADYVKVDDIDSFYPELELGSGNTSEE